MLDDDVSIDVLELSVRSARALRADGIDTIAKLLKIDVPNLLRIPNIGRRSYNEICDSMEVYKKTKSAMTIILNVDEFKVYVKKEIREILDKELKRYIDRFIDRISV